MARSKVDVCLICEATPCACGKPAKPQRAPAKKAAPKPKIESAPAPEPEPQPARKISALDAMRARAEIDSANVTPLRRELDAKRRQSRSTGALEIEAPVSVEPPKPKFEVPEENEEDLRFRQALEALAPILHPEELEKYKFIIPSPDVRTISQRAEEWRKRVRKA